MQLNPNPRALFVCLLLAGSTQLSACNGRGLEQTSYDMLREREYQLCLREGRSDCRRYETYEDYQRQRNEATGSR
ncbi:MAG TPA: hypothetical protein ENJ01_01875 [Gammaproteobacteria bacterium]|nr:hypothetical protein [Gammaproteobacteria bacterium]